MTAFTAVQWRKEVRELLPWWGATVITMVACWLLMHPDVMPIDLVYEWVVLRDRNVLLGAGLCAYVAGTVTLGALSLGNEYAHHTLPALLTHPTSRGRLLVVKLAVLAVMIAGLGVLALGAWGSDPILVGRPNHVRLLLLGIIPLAGGLFLAPWLTMVGRGPLAGAVFTVALSSVLWAVGTSFQLPAGYFWLATITVGAVGAVMTCRTFLRLEAAGEPQADVDLSAWFGRSTAQSRPGRAHSPWSLLIMKELRLQQVTFVVSGIYAAVWLAVVVGRQFAADTFVDSPLFVATFLNTALVPLLAGAIASADERRMGTADWHTLLPIAAWEQWAIKAGVALGTAFALAVVLPTLLASIATEPGWRDGMEPTTVVMLCVGALYISSLSSNALRALLMTGPAIAAAVIVGLMALWPVVEAVQPAVRWLAQALPIVEIDRGAYTWWMRNGFQWVTAGLAALLLRFAYTNHRTADRSLGRAARQFGWLSAYGVAAALFVRLISQMFYNWLRATAAM